MTEKYYYYFAYGMNTNQEQMKIRCPKAIALGAAKLLKHRFDFKCHATVTANPFETVNGVLWKITDSDEDALDILEGYPKYYLKKVVKVEHNGKLIDAMTYYIPNDSLFPPGESYYSMVSEGYKTFGISTAQLAAAKSRAEKNSYGWSWQKTVDDRYYL